VQPSVSELAARSRILFILIAILSLAGLAISGVSLQRHYAKSSSDFCDFSQQFNCDIVNRSEYSELAGIPVAAIGVAGYAVLFFLSTLWKSRPETPARLLVAASVGLVFALYLTYVEAHDLKTWCILCLGSQALIFLITALAALTWTART
jgi:vitamin-K-epoxide reductase (warfarin-sensitive)